MLAKLGAYTIACLVMGLIEVLFFPVTIAVATAFRQAKAAYVWACALQDIVKVVVAFWLVTWLVAKIGQQPSWLMFLIPGIWLLHRGLIRVSHARAGTSRVHQALALSGRMEDYDQAHDIRLELMHLKGDIAGWLIGAALFLRTAPFL